jgi:hypothetical protein
VPKSNVLLFNKPQLFGRGRHHDPILESIRRRLFGCRHRTVSRPFTRAGQTFVTCLFCGMRRRFDLKRWKVEGGFYVQNDR